MNKTLVIWVKSGATLYFEGVEDFECEEDEIIFIYQGVSTDKKRRASFKRNSITGFAIEMDK